MNVVNHREIIPFFSTLPSVAVPAAAKLWEAANAPDYNGVHAYQDFMSRLEDVGVSPPARAIVKRWVAGVQAGLIARPTADGDFVHDGPSGGPLAYFDALPEAARSALQAAWDRADNGFSPVAIFEGFCHDMDHIGHEKPTKQQMFGWVELVRKGEVERPAKQVTPEASPIVGEKAASAAETAAQQIADPRRPKLKGSAERHNRKAYRSADPQLPGAAVELADGFRPLTPADFARPAENPATASFLPNEPVLVFDAIEAGLAAPLRAVRDALVKDTIERLSADLQKTAERIVAQQLLRLASEMSGVAGQTAYTSSCA